MTLRELITWVGFNVDTTALKGYDDAVGKVMNSSTGLFNNLTRLADGITQVGKKMTLGLSLPIAGVATAGVLATSKVEKFRTSFEVMLKDAGAAKNLMGDLFQFEAVTPFNLEQVMNAANKLLIAKEPVKNITNQLMLLGNVAAGDAQRLQSIVYVLGQVRALGYLQGQDIMQFTNALVPIREAIAKVTGVEGKALQKMIEQRKITADMTQKALELIARERSGLMEKQALTLRGLWSSLMSAVFRIRAAIGDMIVSTLHLDVLLKRVIKWFNNLTKFIENLNPTMKKLIVWVGVVVFALGPLLTILGVTLKSLLLIKATIAGLGLVGVKFTLTGLLPLLGKTALAVGAIALKFTLISAAIAAVFIVAEDIIGYFTGKNSVIIPALLKLGDWLENKFREWSGMSKEEWDLTMMYFVKSWEDTFNGIYEFFKGIIQKMKDFIKKEGLFGIFYKMGEQAAKLTQPKNEGMTAAAIKMFPAYGYQIGPPSVLNVNVNGVNVTAPPGNTQQQNEALREQTSKMAKEVIIKETEKAIVKKIRSDKRG